MCHCALVFEQQVLNSTLTFLVILHLYVVKPRHSITTIHENEALGINELTDVTGALNRDQNQSQKESERPRLPNTDSSQEALVILEEELEKAVKTSITKV
ncbi:hypothetical protein scyTo_0014738 [Scyliorhinus torazame]|uniref:Uncharacterized protein n=1 Tax=Scyliorhinus torazame TaxID=75743 RepID=A0A401NTP6_SCYTO|nr:hypothetical protein [Scyliorhinus torazame]